MALTKSPNVTLLRRGKGHFLFQEEGTTGYLHLGNIPSFEVAVELTEDPHYSSMAAEKLLDDNPVVEKGMTATFDLEEFSATNINLAMLGDGIQLGSQSASALDAVETTTIGDLFVSLGKNQLSYLNITHGAITGGPFTAGETITGGTSSATAKVGWMNTAGLQLEVISVSGGPFVVGETLTGGSSAATAVVTALTTVSGAIVTDAATATVRYTLGTDYTIIPDGGMIREISTGSIAANTCYVSADYPALTIGGIRALVDTVKIGAMKFIGTNSTGPKINMDAWRVQIKGGSLSLISEDRGVIPIEATFLADTSNHPNEPFCHWDILE